MKDRRTTSQQQQNTHHTYTRAYTFQVHDITTASRHGETRRATTQDNQIRSTRQHYCCRDIHERHKQAATPEQQVVGKQADSRHGGFFYTETSGDCHQNTHHQRTNDPVPFWLLLHHHHPLLKNTHAKKPCIATNPRRKVFSVFKPSHDCCWTHYIFSWNFRHQNQNQNARKKKKDHS